MAKKEKEIVKVENNAVEENNDAENTKPDETKQDFAKKVETKPIWRIKVVAKFNRWSFNKWEEYEVSETVFKNYDWLFEVKGK